MIDDQWADIVAKRKAAKARATANARQAVIELADRLKHEQMTTDAEFCLLWDLAWVKLYNLEEHRNPS